MLITACLFTYHSRNFLLTTASLSTYDICIHVQAGVKTIIYLLQPALLLTTSVPLITPVNTCKRKSLPFTHYSLPFY